MLQIGKELSAWHKMKKKSSSIIKRKIPTIKDVNIIDKNSRLIFPISFMIFNISYWLFYLMA